ncbi:MAG: hypothetical protein M3315_06395 [Actinomycetota bacterium]|nr:hypothetical protein [Actinomycetota bacterium]
MTLTHKPPPDLLLFVVCALWSLLALWSAPYVLKALGGAYTPAAVHYEQGEKP